MRGHGNSFLVARAHTWPGRLGMSLLTRSVNCTQLLQLQLLDCTGVDRGCCSSSPRVDSKQKQRTNTPVFVPLNELSPRQRDFQFVLTTVHHRTTPDQYCSRQKPTEGQLPTFFVEVSETKQNRYSTVQLAALCESL